MHTEFDSMSLVMRHKTHPANAERYMVLHEGVPRWYCVKDMIVDELDQIDIESSCTEGLRAKNGRLHSRNVRVYPKILSFKGPMGHVMALSSSARIPLLESNPQRVKHRKSCSGMRSNGTGGLKRSGAQ